MSTVNRSKYCEVYIWLGRDDKGKPITASGGGVRSKTKDEARCGHASLGIFDGKKITYLSLWPGESGPTFVQSLEHDVLNEGGKPDPIIQLHDLSIPKMLEAANAVHQKAIQGKVQWVMKASNKDKCDITKQHINEANCASYVYSILKAGNLKDSSLEYESFRSSRGPKDQTFYKQTRCDAAERWGGYFNWAPWTSTHFTPKGLLLRVASSAEAYSDDKKATIDNMNSNRVTEESGKETQDKVIAAATKLKKRGF